MGSVLLGLPGNWAADLYEGSDPYTTKCGGLPDWSEGVVKLIDSSPDTERLLHCSLCGNHLSQVVQAYAPVPAGSGRLDERTLYVMACMREKCGSSAQSWRVLRAQGRATFESQESVANNLSGDSGPQRDDVIHQEMPEGSAAGGHRMASGVNKEWAESDKNNKQEVASWATPSLSGRSGEDMWQEQEAAEGWADGAGGWGGGDGLSLEELSAALVSATQAAARKVPGKGGETEGKGQVDDGRGDREGGEWSSRERGPVLPCFYVYVDAEPGRPTPSSRGKKGGGEEAAEGGAEEERDGAGEGWNGEQYVCDETLSADRTFLKFKKRIDRSPEQCLRYWHGGEPLWARPVSESPGPCSHCGAPKRFEMQLMPPLVYFLQESTGVGEWEWATVAVFTCSENCFGGGSGMGGENEWVLLEESVMVQNEI